MFNFWKNVTFIRIAVYSSILMITYADGVPCVPKSLGLGNTVCVCNVTYCDELGVINLPTKGEFISYISSKEGLRMFNKTGKFQSTSKSHDAPGDKAHVVEIFVNADKKRQKVLGFGGAFTDAAGINILELPKELQKTLISAYYGPESIGYSIVCCIISNSYMSDGRITHICFELYWGETIETMKEVLWGENIGVPHTWVEKIWGKTSRISTGRVPMGGCDFSTRPYTYADHQGDVDLEKFSLQEEDHLLKIPFIKMAKSLNPDLLLYGSPWSAPPWMKTNNDYKGRGLLKPEYYQVWADYFVKFLKSYEKEGLKMWGVTAQNEPIDGLFPYFPFNSMGWTPSKQRTWIKENLGPTLHAKGYKDLKVMILDDNTILLPIWPGKVFSDPDASKYISGIALHWYTNELTKYCGINSTAHAYPDKFILGSEACQGFFPWQKKVDLGSWRRGESYSEDIIRDLENGMVGWTDWNICLDLLGGPNWAGLGADSPIIVNKTSQEFYKQPMFYALAHVSKFFLRDSHIIETDVHSSAKSDLSKLHIVGASRPDDAITIALLNKNDFEIQINLKDSDRGLLKLILPANSMATLLYP